MKNVIVSLLVLVVVAACSKPAAPAVDVAAVQTELQAVVAAEVTSADAFLASLDQAATVNLSETVVVSIDSLRKLAAADSTAAFSVSVDSVAVADAATTAFTKLSLTFVNGADTVNVAVTGSASYTKNETGWAKN